MARVSRLLFAMVAMAMAGCALGLVGAGMYEAVSGESRIEVRLLDVVGYLVIAIAVFDVAKYLLEEEVIREREMRHVAEARRSLTRFISTIIIAVFLEAIVLVFKVVRGDVGQIIYPAALLLTGLALLVGLGAYQRLSAAVEQRVARADDESEQIAHRALEHDARPDIRRCRNRPPQPKSHP